MRLVDVCTLERARPFCGLFVVGVIVVHGQSRVGERAGHRDGRGDEGQTHTSETRRCGTAIRVKKPAVVTGLNAFGHVERSAQS